jgi:hypothetical protein
MAATEALPMAFHSALEMLLVEVVLAALAERGLLEQI